MRVPTPKQTRSKLASVVLVPAVSVALTAGCVAPLTEGQSEEMHQYETKNLVVEKKSPSAAVALGLLPGGGSFYTGHFHTGVINAVTWPASIFWDPLSGYRGAKKANYFATQKTVRENRSEEFARLDERFENNELARDEYIKKRRRVHSKN